MAQTAQDVLRQIHEEGIELIDLKFVDLHGKWQHLTVCRDLIDEAENGNDLVIVRFLPKKHTDRLLQRLFP